MGIDITNSRREHPDRCQWFKAKYVNNNKLDKEAVAEGIFYSKDVEDYNLSYSQVGNMQVILARVKIETNDNVSQMKVNDYVNYNGTLMRVDSIIHGDLNKNKFISNRPSFTSIISLIGKADG